MSDNGELSALIQDILDNHHTFLRETMPVLRVHLRELVEEVDHVLVKQNLLTIHAQFRLLDAEITEHLMKEEQILFPTIRSFEAVATGSPGSQTAGCGVAGPVQQMTFEHGRALKGLDEIQPCRQAISMYTGKVHELLPGTLTLLSELDEDLREHIRREEEELFPAATALEQRLWG